MMTYYEYMAMNFEALRTKVLVAEKICERNFQNGMVNLAEELKRLRRLQRYLLNAMIHYEYEPVLKRGWIW